MSQVFRLAEDIAWLEGEAGSSTEQVVWVSNLDAGVQYELTDTGWLTWMLLTDGFTDTHRLHHELQVIHATLNPEDAAPFSEDILLAFLSVLEQDGLLVRG